VAVEPGSTRPVTPTESIDAVLLVVVASGLALVGAASYWWLRHRG